MAEKLEDLGRSGREKPWANHKVLSTKLSDALFRIGKGSIADRMSVCGNYLKYEGCPDGHEKNLKYASFCKSRFCPMCQWRRSLKIFGEVFEVASLLSQLHKVKWVFLTLTLKNVPGEELSNGISELLSGFNRLVRREPFKSYALGWFRSLEVTRSNQLYYPVDGTGKWIRGEWTGEWKENESYGTYHHHYHVIVPMKLSYLNRGYKTIDEWREIWKECCKLDYLPIVHIQTVNNKKKKKKLQDIALDFGYKMENEDELIIPAIAEVAKYTTKTKDIFYDVNPIVKEDLPLTEYEVDDILIDLYSSIHKRRLAEFGGKMKELKKKRDDAYDEMMILKKQNNHEEKCKCSVCNSDFVDLLYSWLPDFNNYYRLVKDDQVERALSYEDHLKNGKTKIIKRGPTNMGQIKNYLEYGHIDDECD